MGVVGDIRWPAPEGSRRAGETACATLAARGGNPQESETGTASLFPCEALVDNKALPVAETGRQSPFPLADARGSVLGVGIRGLRAVLRREGFDFPDFVFVEAEVERSDDAFDLAGAYAISIVLALLAILVLVAMTVIRPREETA